MGRILVLRSKDSRHGSAWAFNGDHLKLCRSSLIEFLRCVECGDLVALREGWVIEDGLQEVLDVAAQRQNRLADVDQFSGASADDVHSQEFAGVLVEEHF